MNASLEITRRSEITRQSVRHRVRHHGGSLGLLLFSCLGGLIGFALPSSSWAADASPRPNIVWIMSEDNSKHYLRHFDARGVTTPAIESMASHGVTFDRAFSNAPVCSVARTTLITGCYGPRIGTQYHRRMAKAALPDGLQMFPAYLREAGYYTTNCSKEDYNATFDQAPWDASSRRASWQNRPSDDTPFFHVETFTDSHESRLHFKREFVADHVTTTSADTAAVPAYLPDTPLTHFTAAYYGDRMRVIDERVAGVLETLEKADQLENTFVFYFGDHGGVLPRSKGYAYESGLHVPLVVRLPDHYVDLVDRILGERTTGFVSFIDFAPTVLSLAGVSVPEAMDGRAFLGVTAKRDEVDARNTTFGHADRMDEKYDFVRTVREGDWKYIRCFEPFMPDAVQNNYRMKMLAYQQWDQLREAGELDETTIRFFEPRRAEMLFDLASDPDEVVDLSADPNQASRLQRMRRRLSDHLKATHDLSFFPEAVLTESAMPDAAAFGRQNAAAIDRYIDTVNQCVMKAQDAKPALMTSLNSGDPWQRYWSLIAVSSAVLEPTTRGQWATDISLVKLLKRRMLDSEPLVAARAAEALALLKRQDPRPTLLSGLERAVSEPEVLAILNIMAFFDQRASPTYAINPSEIKLSIEVGPKSEVQRRLDFFKQRAAEALN
ncbi:MAG: sulfatase [Planctomycetota bacterium]